MTLNDAFEGRSLKTTHLIQRGSLLALAVTATLILTFGRHNGFMVGVVLALSTVVAPAVYVLGTRLMPKSTGGEGLESAPGDADRRLPAKPRIGVCG